MARVLIVTIGLRGRSGTEVVSIETAHGLRQRGHDIALYTHHPGPTSDQLRADGFEVVTDVGSLASPPEIIQSNQTYPLLDVVGRFPEAPVVSICHDATIWFDEPLDLPAIRRHVAVDLACRDRIVRRFPTLTRRVEILHNAVDLARFKPRATLPARPKRALILAKHADYVEMVRVACLGHGLQVDAVGPGVDRTVADLATRLTAYDVIFATARAALEAMAVGCAVVVVDQRGLAGLVTSDVVASWRDDNFGRRLLSRTAAVETIAVEIDHYDASDAAKVREVIRREASLDRYLDHLEAIHQEVIADCARDPTDMAAFVGALGRSLHGFVVAHEEHLVVTRQSELLAMEKRQSAACQAELQAIEQRQAAVYQEELRAIEQRQSTAYQAELQAIEERRAAVYQEELQAIERRQSAAYQAELQAIEERQSAVYRAALQAIENR
jgi:hypothetical protein